MRNILRFAAVGVLFLTAAFPLKAQTPTRIYVYADWDSPLHSWISVYCDGTLMAKVKRGKFLAINTTPGRHTLEVGEGVPVFVDVSVGKEVFATVGHVVQLTETGKLDIPVISVVSGQEAQLKIIHLVYIDAREMYSPAVSRTDPSLDWEPALKKRSKHSNKD